MEHTRVSIVEDRDFGRGWASWLKAGSSGIAVRPVHVKPQDLTVLFGDWTCLKSLLGRRGWFIFRLSKQTCESGHALCVAKATMQRTENAKCFLLWRYLSPNYVGGLFFYIFFCGRFWIFFFVFLVLCFPAFLLFCFSAFLLLCFSASLLCCFSASLLFCFLLFLLFPFPAFSFSAFLLFPFPAFFSAFCFSCFFLFRLFPFPASLLFMLLCFSALSASFLFCFSAFPASAFLLLCFCAFLLLLVYFFFFLVMCFCCSTSCCSASLLLPVFTASLFFPQQRKLMGSSAQNSSGVHWCRRRVRFNEVPEKVPKVPEKVWEALVQSQVTWRLWCRAGSGSIGFRRRFPEALAQSRSASTKFRRRFRRRRFRRRCGRLWCRARQVQQGAGEGARSGSTLFRRRFRRRCGRLWCRLGSTGFRRRFRTRFWGGLGAEPGQVQQGSGEGSGEGLGGFGAEPGQV